MVSEAGSAGTGTRRTCSTFWIFKSQTDTFQENFSQKVDPQGPFGQTKL